MGDFSLSSCQGLLFWNENECMVNGVSTSSCVDCIQGWSKMSLNCLAADKESKFVI